MLSRSFISTPYVRISAAKAVWPLGGGGTLLVIDVVYGAEPDGCGHEDRPITKMLI